LERCLTNFLAGLQHYQAEDCFFIEEPVDSITLKCHSRIPTSKLYFNSQFDILNLRVSTSTFNSVTSQAEALRPDRTPPPLLAKIRYLQMYETDLDDAVVKVPTVCPLSCTVLVGDGPGTFSTRTSEALEEITIKLIDPVGRTEMQVREWTEFRLLDGEAMAMSWEKLEKWEESIEKSAREHGMNMPSLTFDCVT
jgi:hypothetical protein